MISRDFIHAYDDEAYFDNLYEESMRDVDGIFADLYVASAQKRDLETFGIYTEEKEELFQESVSDVIEKIGQKILDIIQQFKDGIKRIFDKFNQNKWNKMDIEQKMAAIKKKDPTTADKVRVALSKGDIDFRSFKDLDDFLSKSEKLLADFDKKHPDPKSLQAKWNKIKDEFTNKSSGASAIQAMFSLVAAGGSLVMLGKNYSKAKSDKITSACKVRKAREENLQTKCLDRINAMKSAKVDPEVAASTARIYCDICAASSQYVGSNLSKVYKLSAKIVNGLGKQIDKVTKKTVDDRNAILDDYRTKNDMQRRSLRNDLRDRERMLEDNKVPKPKTP